MMMQHLTYDLKEVIEILKGDPVALSDPNASIKDILIDSRKLITPEQTIFFALVSRRNDGHRYVSELYEKGIRNFVVTKPPEDLSLYREANFIKVPNTLSALQSLARCHREKFNIPVIGITGSNGKTIVKEWLFQLLSKDKKTVRSPKSYNSQIGVPLSVWQLDPRHEAAIFEAGISEPDEMDKLQSVIRPEIGIFTNIGEAHAENFISTAQKIGEKLKLFTKVRTLVYSPDHGELQEIIIRSEILKSIRSFTWSRKQDADLRITGVESDGKRSMISAIWRGDSISVTIPFIDDASVENAIHCWAVMLLMGYENSTIAPWFAQLTPVAMRLELKAGVNHCTIINDSYNSDIKSLSIAIDFLNQQANQKKTTVILSDILQSGKGEEELYTNIAEIIDNKQVDRLIGIGPAISRQADKFHTLKEFYPSTDEFMRRFSFSYFSNEVILLKGARMFEFEQISKALQQKTHETVLEINLNAVVQNLNYFRSKLDPETRIMAMVKAYSYGSGSFEIANTLQFHRVDYLAVAYADEGVELRKAGIQLPIMVMNPDEQSFDSIIKHSLEPEIYNFRMLDVLEKSISKNILPRNKPVKVHIKLDTGMHRLGFSEDETDLLAERLMANRMIYTQSVFSHLAAVEDPSEDQFTREQIERFRGMGEKVRTAVDHKVLFHILNSAGILRFPEARFDMVRVGIGLYGVNATEEEAGNLQPVNTLRSIISQIKHLRPGDTVSYGRTFRAEKEMTIGIVPIGYADGLARRLSNRGHLMVRGYEIPIIGNICMDMCMVDLTGVKAKEGDEVIVFGRERPIEKLAEEMETIPYEILTSISRRVKRVYYQE